MNNKNKILVFFAVIILVTSVYFITSFSFRTGTYIEMYPAFSGTVCVLDNGNCVTGTTKLLNDFGLAKIWPDKEMKLTGQPAPYLMGLISFDGVKYYGGVSGEDTEEITQNERGLTIEFAEKIAADRFLLDFSDPNIKSSYTPPISIRLMGQIFILNQDESVTETDVFEVVFAGNSTEVRELSINQNGQIYTLVSIEKSRTEPITYTLEG